LDERIVHMSAWVAQRNLRSALRNAFDIDREVVGWSGLLLASPTARPCRT
jgi:hypothetical protein